MKRIFSLIVLVVGLAGFSIAQTASIKVEVGGKVTEMSAADLAKLPRKEVAGKDHDGKESTFSGVEVREILTAAGAKLGAEIRGKRLAEYLLVEAADGYRAVYAIAELDPEFAAGVVILADKQDGKAFDEKKGPFQVVAPADKRHGRWVRQVRKLSLNSVVDTPPVAESGSEDTIREKVFFAFFSYISLSNNALGRISIVYLGVDGRKDPSRYLVSRLRSTSRDIRPISQTGPLRTDGTLIDQKPDSLRIVISPIRWLSDEKVEAMISSIESGQSCRYLVIRRKDKWDVEAEAACVIA